MISKIPNWVWAGAWALAFVAGLVNVVALLGFEHQPITHLTGTTSLLALAVANANSSGALHLLAVLASFVSGCTLSGILIKDSALQVGRRYGAALILETILLCAAVPLLHRHSLYGLYAASCACGLQNAMVSTYSGTVVRTSHLSGMFTDLGIFLGHALRKIPVDLKRLRLCLLIISGFFTGGLAGAIAFRFLSYSALFIPAAVTLALAVLYHYFILLPARAKTKSQSTINAAN